VREGRRILDAFDGQEMWVTVVAEEDRRAIKGAAVAAGVVYVVVPIRPNQLAVLTTGHLQELEWEAELVAQQYSFITDSIMKLRWTGTISSPRGFLPPARPEPGLFEAFHKHTSRRCWHLHLTTTEAEACAEQMKKLDGVKVGWYVRSASEWRKVGRFEQTGEELRATADLLGIKTSTDTSRLDGKGLDLVIFEPMRWEDPRFIRLRKGERHERPRPENDRDV
jgi:hypothetical protein